MAKTVMNSEQRHVERQPISLQALVDVYAQATANAYGHATATHAGVAAVLEALSAAATSQAACDLETYDHRSLFAFAARLHRSATKPGEH